jgi:hypothetical protein
MLSFDSLEYSSTHRVGRVLSFFSSRRNWNSPNPSPAGEFPPPPVLGVGAHTLAREGLGLYENGAMGFIHLEDRALVQ